MKRLLIILAFSLLAINANSEKHCYIPVSAGFRSAHEHHKKDCNVLVVIPDTAGNYFVSLNAINEFPELFDSLGQVSLYWLDSEAFPSTSTVK